MNFIKTCQSLRDYGITLFLVRFSKSKKEVRSHLTLQVNIFSN